MLAIPSPDLLLNLFASATQALGLLLVVLGGTFWSRRAPKSAATRRGGSRALVWLFGLAFVATAVAFLLYHLATIDAHNRRLRTNLVRTSVEAGKKVGDVSLRTLDLSGQMDHPGGIATEEIAARLARGDALNLVDVREPEEVEVARIAGSWHRRYPDLMRDQAGLVRDGVETVLLCESGNRSSELCEDFTKLGVRTRFMIGGYEKWIAEERPVEGLSSRERNDLRAIPDYPNKEVLLDTPDVMRLVEQEGAIFVDVRYPKDLELHALPGAINLPMRRMPSEEIAQRLAELPRRPIVVPGYDKRSSFYGMILGLRLHRMGHDFRGRYMAPHDWFVPAAEREYVTRWRTEQEGRTLLASLQQPVAASLRWLQANAGGLLPAILLLVLGLRLLLLPLTWRVERDACLLARLAPELASLRARLGDDGLRLQRATAKLLRQHRVAPLRNLLASALQIFLFVLAYAAVDTVAFEGRGDAATAPRAAPIVALLLAAVAGFLTWRLLCARGRAKTRLRALLRVVGATLLAVIVWPLAWALQVYLLASLGSALAHGWLFQLWSARGTAPARAPRAQPAQTVLPLRDADRRPDTGAKASRLAQLVRAGLPVPPGFVVSGEAFADGIERLNGTLDDAWSALAAARVAVRSSGASEDGAFESRAGVYDTLLGVRRERLEAALLEVHGSLNGERACALGNGGDHGGVLVQAMVEAEFAGVLFTEDPACTGCSLVEMVEGLGDELVSGRATPLAYRFTRLGDRQICQRKPPVDLQPLLELGNRVERLFGRPQDIEWAYSGGRFQLLQARDITRDATSRQSELGRRERERRRLLQLVIGRAPDAPAFGLTELCELLPEPTPYSRALMESLWAPGGSVDLACRELGIRYEVDEDSPPFVVTLFGRLYVDLEQQRRRFARGLGAVAGLRLGRGAEAIERVFREEFSPVLTRELRLREAIDFSRLELEELLALRAEWQQRFVTETYVRAEVVNLAAEHYAETARQRLTRAGIDPSVCLAAFPPTVLHRAWELLREHGPAAAPQFLELCGHRAPHDFELAEPRYGETPQIVAAMARDAQSGAPASRPEPQAMRGRVLQLVVDRALRFQTLKEDAKHICLRELALLRRMLVEIGARSGLGELVFFLEPEEFAQLADPAGALGLHAVAAERRQCRAEWRDLQLPNELSPAALATLFLSVAAAPDRNGHDPDLVHGERVAGDHDAIGRARLLTRIEDAGLLEPGEILVARFTDPSWTPLFRRAGGIVTEVGGWLSHAAIQARELNLPAIVGARGVLGSIRTGELLQLGRDGTVRRIAERRSEPRRRQEREIWLVTADGPLSGTLLDTSAGGARVRCQALPVGARLRLNVAGSERVCEVVRETGDGVGVRYVG